MAITTKAVLKTKITTDVTTNTTGANTGQNVQDIMTNTVDTLWALQHTLIDNTDSPYTLDVSVTQVLLCDPTSGAITVNLPAIASNNNAKVFIKNIGTTNSVTIDGNSAETIDGATTKVLSTQWAGVLLYGDGADGNAWYILADV